MKQRAASLILALALVLGLVSCGRSASTWQEQYDLGVRYLSEGNYEEAIIAFNAAIEIDPKRAEAYLSLADVYLALEDYAQRLGLALRGTSLEEYLVGATMTADPQNYVTRIYLPIQEG